MSGPEEWYVRPIEEAFRREAEEECLKCQGRAHGDCDPRCQYWRATASQAEKVEYKRRDANATTKAKRRKHVRVSRAWMFKIRNRTWPEEQDE